MKIVIVALVMAVMGGLTSVRSDHDLTITPNQVGLFCIMPEFPDSFKQAHAVFVGVVVKITPSSTKDSQDPRLGQYYNIRFRVEKSWKGTRYGRYFTVQSDHGAKTELAFPVVHLGEKYLVFADPIYFNGVPQRQWSGVSACNRTKLVSKASEDLRRLETLYPLRKAKNRAKPSRQLSGG